ncbi:DUF2878 domain-containing protein [Pseudomonas sp. zfem002]|uniref:DUF2878 domain-containing protein n=1 Tax=Pseudomonas sp. zfem002 TaxID=3078197 RepID=UPI002929D678|nr:DUF2878 domain-containing protein [Pseudomonas sp. zfem002]MDU9394780.1 DUF2878 domain-containing protein [Pseudomonas sp. zfem002]
MTRAWLLGNALWLQAGWWGCVLGARYPGLLLGVLVGLLIHLCLCRRRIVEVRVLLMIGLAGCVLDALLGAVGVFDFAQRPLPVWLALLWLVLASGMRHSLAWLGRPVWLALLCGLVGGPLAYLAGARLTGVGLPLGMVVTAMVLGMVWAVWFPLCLWLVGRVGAQGVEEDVA